MPARIWIGPHEQIVLILIDLDTCVKICALEHAVEDELLVFGYGGVHTLEDAAGFGLKIWVKFTKVRCHVQVVAVNDTLYS